MTLVCSPYGGGAARSCVQLHPVLTLLQGAGPRRAQCLGMPPAWCPKGGSTRGCAESLGKSRLLVKWAKCQRSSLDMDCM